VTRESREGSVQVDECPGLQPEKCLPSAAQNWLSHLRSPQTSNGIRPANAGGNNREDKGVVETL